MFMKLPFAVSLSVLLISLYVYMQTYVYLFVCVTLANNDRLGELCLIRRGNFVVV